MDGCVYRTKDGECDLYSEGGKFKAFCDMEHCDNIAPSNADRIRAMTDNELAKFLDFVRGSKNYPIYYTDWIEWLKQESKE